MTSARDSTNYGGASTRAIQRHYDLGTPFYELWLDPTLTYSAGLWDGVQTLEEAQLQKLDFHIRNAEASEARRVLDVGCGWGSMLVRSTNRHHVRHSVGLTLSQEQHDFINRLGQEQIEVRLENWADHSPEADYDAIVCVGMLEHCAHVQLLGQAKIQAYAVFFKKCHEWLKSRGCISLQTICFGTLRELDPFIQQKIWPESNLPLLSEVVIASEDLFEIERLRCDRLDYSKTCRIWAENLASRRTEATAIVGESTVAEYLQFLKMSARGFETGALSLYRFKMRRLR